MTISVNTNGTEFELAEPATTPDGGTQAEELAERQARVLERTAKITNANWRKGWKPTNSVPPKGPCLYYGRAIPADSGPVAELKRAQGEVPREWAYLEAHPGHPLAVGDSTPWCESGGGWGAGPAYARTGRALEWACGCITTYSVTTRYCRSGHGPGGDYHEREWTFACSELHLEIYAGYVLRSYWEPIKLEPVEEARKAERAARKIGYAESAMRIAEAKAAFRAHVDRGTCPKCGGKLSRNPSLAGWWQCEQLGAESFRKDPKRPSCNFQGFTE